MPFPEPPPLPDPLIPIPMAVYCRRLYQPCFLLSQRYPKLWCQWSSLIGLGTLSTLWIFGGWPGVSLFLWLSNRIFVTVPVNKWFLLVPWLCSYQLINALCRLFRVLDRTCSSHLALIPFLRDSSWPFLMCRAGCLKLLVFLRASCTRTSCVVPVLRTSWSLCYNQIVRTERLVPFYKLLLFMLSM